MDEEFLDSDSVETFVSSWSESDVQTVIGYVEQINLTTQKIYFLFFYLICFIIVYVIGLAFYKAVHVFIERF